MRTYNDSCVPLASNAMTTSKTKHIDIRYHYSRDLAKLGSISIVWCPTVDMLADILTKFSLPSPIHLKHARRMLSGIYYLVLAQFKFHGECWYSRTTLCIPMY